MKTISIIMLFIFISLPSIGNAKNILIFVNGNDDCCIERLKDKIINDVDEHFSKTLIVPWSNFKVGWKSDFSLDHSLKRRFVKSGKKYLEKLPLGTNIYIVGHSWGGDSALMLTREYTGNNINIRLLALLDPVGPGGVRKNLKGNTAPSRVKYFFNRWQTSGAIKMGPSSFFPVDHLVNGTIKCDSKNCDQGEQSHKKHANGEAKKKDCRFWENCKKKRIPLGHTSIVDDDYIVQQIKNIITNMTKQDKKTISSIEFSYHKIYKKWPSNKEINRYFNMIDGKRKSIIQVEQIMQREFRASSRRLIIASYKKIFNKQPAEKDIEHYLSSMLLGMSIGRIETRMKHDKSVLDTRSLIITAYKKTFNTNPTENDIRYYLSMIFNDGKTIKQVERNMFVSKMRSLVISAYKENYNSIPTEDNIKYYLNMILNEGKTIEQVKGNMTMSILLPVFNILLLD